MDGSTILLIVIAAVVVVLIAAFAWAAARKRHTHHLQDRFGPEYDRTIEGADNRREAEAELREREERRAQLNIVPLDEERRALYTEQWAGIQQRFVDTPTESVAEADVLVMQVMRDRGYPVDDFDRRASDISVDHPDVVEHYRSAHDVAGRSRTAGVETEELRQAVVHYRALFEALLEDRPDVDLRDDQRTDDQVVDLNAEGSVRQF